MGRRGGVVKPLVPPGRAPPKGAVPVTSKKLARKLTTAFHALLNEQGRVTADATLSADARKTTLRELEARIAAIGGREA
jgi:hypothetical protein